MSGHDVFICHAFEDKAAVARPLADFLKRNGADVWYDEFSLRLGDSLSGSIDTGLASSSFGVVILSESFFTKRWPAHELGGLVAKEMSSGKTILPVWHKLNADQVRNFSPTLANKKAIVTGAVSIEEIGLRILEVIRPDIFANLRRRQLLNSIVATGTREWHSPLEISSDLPIRHACLPVPLLVRIRLLCELLDWTGALDLEETITDMRRENEPEREVQVWERIAASYLLLSKQPSYSDANRMRLFASLLQISTLGSEKEAEYFLGAGDDIGMAALQAWLEVVPTIGQPRNT